MRQTSSEHREPRSAFGRISASKCPDTLELITFVEAAPWRSLMPDDREWGLFLWAWHEQEAWSAEVHSSFWEAAIQLWPRKAGRRHTTELLSRWVWNLRNAGFDDAACASHLGYHPDSLRRRGVFRMADAYGAAMKALKAGTLVLLRAPAVWAPEIQGEPPGEGYCALAFRAISAEDWKLRDHYQALAANGAG